MPGDIVIEYVGELINNTIADFREIEYDLRGFGDCYLFRVDSSTIVIFKYNINNLIILLFYQIDASKYGNLARFINYCCDPNCSAESKTIENNKHILLYAKKPILKGEEITYNYNFEYEEEKIQCRCGSVNCQGRLN